MSNLLTEVGLLPAGILAARRPNGSPATAAAYAALPDR